MEIIEEKGIRFRIDTENQTASVINSPDAKEKIMIPRFVKYQNHEYIITCIDKHAFMSNQINSLYFSPDSEVKIFKRESFFKTTISTLGIPSKLETIEPGCFFKVDNLQNIQVSPRNNHFSYIDKKYLVEKKADGTETLIYIRFNLEEAIIPSAVKYIRPSSLINNTKLKSLSFTNESIIERIQYGIIPETLTQLVIPKSLQTIDQICFQLALNLTKVIVLKDNKTFRGYNGILLLRLIEGTKFFELIFCNRDAVEVIIPSAVKKISSYAFSNCNKITSISFTEKSVLDTIDEYAFSPISGQIDIDITFPVSLKNVESFAFEGMKNLRNVRFLSSEIRFGHNSFNSCDNLKGIFLNEAKKITLSDSFPDTAKIHVLNDAEIESELFFKYKSQIKYLNSQSMSSDKDKIELLEQENEKLKLYVEKLKSSQINTNKHANQSESSFSSDQQSSEHLKPYKELEDENEELKRKLAEQEKRNKKLKQVANYYKKLYEKSENSNQPNPALPANKTKINISLSSELYSEDCIDEAYPEKEDQNKELSDTLKNGLNENQDKSSQDKRDQPNPDNLNRFKKSEESNKPKQSDILKAYQVKK